MGEDDGILLLGVAKDQQHHIHHHIQRDATEQELAVLRELLRVELREERDGDHGRPDQELPVAQPRVLHMALALHDLADGLVEEVFDGVGVKEVGLLRGHLRRRGHRTVARHLRRRRGGGDGSVKLEEPLLHPFLR